MTRVLLLIKGLGRGGAERLVVDTVRYLDPTRSEVDVAYVLPWKCALVDEVRELGARVVCLGDARGRAWIPALRALSRSRRYDVVHAHSPVAGAAVRVVARAARHVYTEHNVWDRYRTATRWANMATFARNDRVIAVSDGVRSSIRYAGPFRGRPLPPIETLRHGVDPAGLERRASLSDGRAALAIPADVPLVTTVANFKPAKRHDVLLDAFARVRRRVTDAHLILVGTGPLEARLRARAAELGVSGAVRFAGVRDDVPSILAASDAFALASRHEGLPISLLEAMALGVPPVVTAVGGCPEVVEDGVSGRLVPPDDAEALAGALAGVLEDGAARRRLARAARARASRFHVSTAAARIERIYDEVSA